jgi:hypothetical protein
MATSKGRLTKLASVLEQAIDCQVDFEQHPQCLPLGRVKRLMESLPESVQRLSSRLMLGVCGIHFDKSTFYTWRVVFAAR